MITKKQALHIMDILEHSHLMYFDPRTHALHRFEHDESQFVYDAIMGEARLVTDEHPGDPQ